MAYTQAQVNSQGSWSYTAPGATPTIPVWGVNPDAVSIVNRICTVGVTGIQTLQRILCANLPMEVEYNYHLVLGKRSRAFYLGRHRLMLR